MLYLLFNTTIIKSNKQKKNQNVLAFLSLLLTICLNISFTYQSSTVTKGLKMLNFEFTGNFGVHNFGLEWELFFKKD